MPSSAVTSLAILKVNWERLGRDYLDNLIPFVVSAVCNGPKGAVSLPAVQATIQESFGLLLPLNPLKTILSRLSRMGHIRRESGAYFTESHECGDEQFVALRQAASDQITSLVSKLIAFAKANFDTSWSRDQAEVALLGFVSEQGLEALYANAEGRVVPSVEPGAADRFMVGSFVIHVQATEPSVFDDVLAVVKGHVLSNALYLPDTGSVDRHFNKTTVYFDTSFLVYACGFAGKDRQAPCGELIALLKKHGARLSCFRETVEEVRGILDACASMMRRKDVRAAYGPTIEHFLQAGILSTDVDLLAARCEIHIQGLGVRIEERPDVDRPFQIDETGLEATLRETIRYKNRSALVHDVNCIAAIMRHRGGTESNSIENCRAIFVTTNAALATAARRFFQHDAPVGAVAPALSSHALGHVLWLKDPTAAPNLPIRQIIADASAAMQPSDALWKAYLTEIARLESQGTITGEEYFLLRHSHSAKRALMDLTQGDADAFAEGTVPEILEVARRNLRADLELELVVAKGTLVAKENQIVELSSKETARVAAIEKTATQIARYVVSGVFGLVVVGLSIATIYTFPWNLPQPRAEWLRYSLGVLQAALLLYTLTSMVWGTTITGLLGKLRDRLTQSLVSRLTSWLGVAS
jgi:hypothetical protein